MDLKEALKLDENNLIALCSTHHAICDRGGLPCDEVMKIISEQEIFSLMNFT